MTAPRPTGFTLLELLLVMVILTTLMAVVAPVLSGSVRGHKLEQETARLLAVTDFGRDQAISEGVPVVLWIDKGGRTYGVDPKTDYYGSTAHKMYALGPEVSFGAVKPEPNGNGSTIIEFQPDGNPTATSASSVQLLDRRGASNVIVLRGDAAGYELSTSRK